MTWDGLADAAARLGARLDPGTIQALRRLHRLLQAANQAHNLTRLIDDPGFLSGHLLDALSLVPWLDGDRSLIDVGTGAGFPALPLALALPQLTVTALDGTRKKIRFVEEAADDLGLVPRVAALWGRAEEVARQPEHREQYDAATARAVAALPTVLELTLPFVRVGGEVLAQRADPKQAIAETKQAAPAIEALGGTARSVEMVEVPGQGKRAVVRVGKVATTPDAYPRRPGIPKKRPL